MIKKERKRGDGDTVIDLSSYNHIILYFTSWRMGLGYNPFTNEYLDIKMESSVTYTENKWD